MEFADALEEGSERATTTNDGDYGRPAARTALAHVEHDAECCDNMEQQAE